MSGTYSHTFKWPHPAASEVWITGTFDDWKKSVKLEKVDSHFEKTVDLPLRQKVLYKFVVDDNWIPDTSQPTEIDDHNNTNNVLEARDSPDNLPTAMSSAAHVSKDEEKSIAPGAFIETPANENTIFSVNPLPATGAKDINSFVTTDQKSYEMGAPADNETFSINPLPATAGGDNPITLKPGEKVPDPSTFTSNTVNSTVTLEKEFYEKGNSLSAAAAAIPATVAAAAAAVGSSLFSTPPVEKGTMPAEDVSPFINSVGAGSTTAMLAGQVPLEPKSIPEPVVKSQQEAGAAPEASAFPTVVANKAKAEDELKATTTEAKVTSESPQPASSSNLLGTITAAATGGIATLTAAVGAATLAAKDTATNLVGGDTATSSTTPAIAPEHAATAVPAVVKDSLAEANKSLEAVSNPVAVLDKTVVEKELLNKVPEEKTAGEPAPTITAATSPIGPGPTTNAATSSTGPASGVPAAVPVPETAKGSTSPAPGVPVAAPVPEPAKGSTEPSKNAATLAPVPEPAKGPVTPKKAESKATSSSPNTASSANNTPDTASSIKKKRKSLVIKAKEFLHKHGLHHDKDKASSAKPSS